MTDLAAVVDAAVETVAAAHRREASRVLDEHLPPAAGALRGRSAAARAGAVEPADQRREVHRPVRHDPPARDRGRQRRSRSRSPTPASVSRRTRSPRCSRCSRRSRSAQDRSEGGLGIGLALSKGVVDLHGGTIEARKRRHRARQRVHRAHSAQDCRGTGDAPRRRPATPVRARPSVACSSPTTTATPRNRSRMLLDMDGHDGHRGPSNGSQALRAIERVPSRGGAARHRHAGTRRLRGRAPHSRESAHAGIVLIAVTAGARKPTRRARVRRDSTCISPSRSSRTLWSSCCARPNYRADFRARRPYFGSRLAWT